MNSCPVETSSSSLAPPVITQYDDCQIRIFLFWIFLLMSQQRENKKAIFLWNFTWETARWVLFQVLQAKGF